MSLLLAPFNLRQTPNWSYTSSSRMSTMILYTIFYMHTHPPGIFNGTDVASLFITQSPRRQVFVIVDWLPIRGTPTSDLEQTSKKSSVCLVVSPTQLYTSTLPPELMSRNASPSRRGRTLSHLPDFVGSMGTGYHKRNLFPLREGRYSILEFMDTITLCPYLVPRHQGRGRYLLEETLLSHNVVVTLRS